ncbi:GGDEF domain-containing protein [Gemmatimonas groenlandica]|uniref:diguanylate cyclase n=1 Tax=Gemmatimonas groenlandica TaxID=2732249 RepID=A0A6M4IJS3_9BACT|nr:GGDEF domain-containing protein [Gemmatimonas groenlandica]QJR34315.1 GGDEF domain-containing protein [Gemmatimonas groenlandica]
MFFKKLVSEPRPSIERSSSNGASGSPVLKSISGGPGTEISVAPTAQSSENALGLVLDALGGVLTALSRYPIDLPDRPAEKSAEEIARWQRHATMGYPLEEGAGTLGVADRDWDGVVRAVTEQRREEHKYVDSSITELREALWACVETVHNAVKIDHTADASTETQMDRAKNALKRMQTGSIKQEVLGAVLAIEGALQSRRDQQQEQYVSLATKLDRMGKQLEEARKESTTDPLTGIGNRKLFDMMGPRAVQMFALGRQPVVLLMIDLDKLKLVNDMYGHQAGDAAIANLGGALSKVFLRQSDVLCRYGGDEFVAILHNTDWKMAQTLARRLQEQVAAMPAPHPAMEFSIGASVGVAQLEAHEEVDEWIARADKALYKAKQNGRDRVCVAESLLLKTA